MKRPLSIAHGNDGPPPNGMGTKAILRTLLALLVATMASSARAGQTHLHRRCAVVDPGILPFVETTAKVAFGRSGHLARPVQCVIEVRVHIA